MVTSTLPFLLTGLQGMEIGYGVLHGRLFSSASPDAFLGRGKWPGHSFRGQFFTSVSLTFFLTLIVTLLQGKEIGRGLTGTVYHGMWQGSDVAVKLFPAEDVTPALLHEFR
jgi:hypothetical protein